MRLVEMLDKVHGNDIEVERDFLKQGYFIRVITLLKCSYGNFLVIEYTDPHFKKDFYILTDNEVEEVMEIETDTEMAYWFLEKRDSLLFGKYSGLGNVGKRLED